MSRPQRTRKNDVQPTIYLMRTQPKLWLSCLVASVATFLLSRLRYAPMHWIVTHVGHQHSVLATLPVERVPGSLVISLLALIRVLLEAGAVVVQVIALFITARWLTKIRQTLVHPENLTTFIGRIVQLSLLIFLVGAAGSVVAFLPASMYIQHARHPALFTSPWVLGGETAVALSVVAATCTRQAMRLIAAFIHGESDDQKVATGRQFAVYTALTIGALTILQGFVGRSVVVSDQQVAFGLLSSIVLCVPYIFLFISMTLLCSRSSETAT